MIVLGALLFGLPVFLATYALTGQPPRSWSESFADSAVRSGLYQTVALVVSFAGVYVIVWVWLRWYERRPFWTVGFERDGAIRKALRVPVESGEDTRVMLFVLTAAPPDEEAAYLENVASIADALRGEGVVEAFLEDETP